MNAGRPALERAEDRFERERVGHDRLAWRLDGAQRQVGVDVGDRPRVEPAIGSIPGDEPVERGQDVGGGRDRVDRDERAGLDAVADRLAEARLVGVATPRDVVAPAAIERAPLVDEDAGPLDVVGDDPDVGPDERDQVDARAEHERARVGRLDGVGRGLEPGGRPLDDRPQDFLLRGDVGVQAGALDVDRARDVAHARPRVAMLVEERACRVFDRLPAGRLDHRGKDLLTNAC